MNPYPFNPYVYNPSPPPNLTYVQQPVPINYPRPQIVYPPPQPSVPLQYPMTNPLQMGVPTRAPCVATQTAYCTQKDCFIPKELSDALNGAVVVRNDLKLDITPKSPVVNLLLYCLPVIGFILTAFLAKNSPQYKMWLVIVCAAALVIIFLISILNAGRYSTKNIKNKILPPQNCRNLSSYLIERRGTVERAYCNATTCYLPKQVADLLKDENLKIVHPNLDGFLSSPKVSLKNILYLIPVIFFAVMIATTYNSTSTNILLIICSVSIFMAVGICALWDVYNYNLMMRKLQTYNWEPLNTRVNNSPPEKFSATTTAVDIYSPVVSPQVKVSLSPSL